MPEHTPTPWVRGRGHAIWQKDGPLVVDLTPTLGDRPIDAETLKANAALIVRAVNAHEELVAALVGLVEAFDTLAGEPFDNPPDSPWVAARAAIEKATES